MLDDLIEAALEAKLYEPDRRRILLGRIKEPIKSTLPVYDRPRDQLISDVQSLFDLSQSAHPDSEPILSWLKTAQSLVSSPQLEAAGAMLLDALETTSHSASRLPRDYRPDGLELPTRRDVVAASLEQIAHPNRTYRATFAGPFFLHPAWYAKRRDSARQMPNFDTALAQFVRDCCSERNLEVRFVFTFSPRYEQKLSEFVQPNEREHFRRNLFSATEGTWGQNAERGPDLCIMHPGYRHIDQISDQAAIVTYRSSQLSRVARGRLHLDPRRIDVERARFDEIFDDSSRGQVAELAALRERIAGLWQ